MKRRSRCIVLTALATVALSTPARAQAPAEAPAKPAEPAVLKEDIVYGEATGVALKLDLARPTNPGAPTPAVLYFHGGGWQAGSKRGARSLIWKLALQGYAAASVEYRFVPEHPWPAQVYDAKAAVRFLRAHAAEYHIDPDRIAVMGDSAGAYLALMLGVTDAQDGLEGDSGTPGVSSRVQAVVSYYSATDFTHQKPFDPKQFSPELDAMLQAYYHKPTREVFEAMRPVKDLDDPIYERMSVLPYVSSDDPPVAIFHGDADPILPTEHALKLDRALTAAGVPHELHIVHGGGHGFVGPQLAEAERQSLEFLNRWLKPAK